MKRKPEDLDLEYVNGRIDRLYAKVKEIENTMFSWMRETDKKFDEITAKTGSKVKG